MHETIGLLARLNVTDARVVSKQRGTYSDQLVAQILPLPPSLEDSVSK